MAAAKSTFAQGGDSCSADSLADTDSSALRINPESFRDGEKPTHRKSANRCGEIAPLIRHNGPRLRTTCDFTQALVAIAKPQVIAHCFNAQKKTDRQKMHHFTNRARKKGGTPLKKGNSSFEVQNFQNLYCVVAIIDLTINS